MRQAVLMTRPRCRGQALYDSILKAGHDPIWVPTIAYEQCDDRYSPDTATDIIIFLSQQAVHCAESFIKTQLIGTGKTIVAIGIATARALRDNGIMTVETPCDDHRTEGLLALPALQCLSGKKILVVTGLGGRDALIPSLSAKGAIVTRLNVYKRIVPALDTTRLILALHNDCLAVSLFYSVESALPLLSALDDDDRGRLCRVPCVVPSQRVATALTLHGCEQVIVAAPSDDAMWQIAEKQLVR